MITLHWPVVFGAEVHVRTRCSLFVTGLLACASTLGMAQTSPGTMVSPTAIPGDTDAAAGQQSVQPLPEDAPTGPQAAPVPSPVPANSNVEMPAYAGQQTAPTPAPAPQPVSPVQVVPATPTPQNPFVGYTKYGTAMTHDFNEADGSTYIPVDSWIYPAMLRLYSLGYVDTMFLGMRPWTRRVVLHMLLKSEADILDSDDAEAQEILATVLQELKDEVPNNLEPRGAVFGLYSAYTRLMGVSGPTLRDSYHLGQTLVNDYGRPYQSGFNNITGFSSVNEYGRFSLFVRGEYQHAPSGSGYSTDLSALLSNEDGIPYSDFNVPQDSIPQGPIAAQNPFRLQEANLSFVLANHEISLGKSDAWLGPGFGGSMAWSNNAEDIYSFRVNRVEPLYIPYFSALLGPIRYDFFYGSLKGHTYPNDDWTHSEMVSFKPTANFEFGFQRTIIFGGKGHEPVTLHTFLRGFFDINDTTAEEKYSREDPGARFSAFTFSYRLPFLRKYATLTLDSIAHDDVTPISAPRRAAFRTGLYIAQFPRLRKLDFRAEAAMTDQPVQRSFNGYFSYYETIQRNGYTNKGFIMGDWIGREAKGGQAWLTYHLSGNEWVQLAYLNKKNAKDFYGTTQNQFKVDVMKRLRPDIEMDAWVQYERWKVPVYKAGLQSDTVAAVQLTFYPQLHRTAGFK